ncbi:Uncharacterized protein DBV15_03407 [Temnothorax longispinosus]|uniref:Uncharacterized protein n=1 Tax=Temnothorax longispinosus TaxID=300112 RepID=A0A4S2KLV6_9HYME|nr:Uncharacterized protein DBV15_03407 [Temnothorax longispinosus]
MTAALLDEWLFSSEIYGAATSSTFQRRDKFCERVLHICIAPPRPSTKPFQGDYARVCANDCDTEHQRWRWRWFLADRGEKGEEKDSGASQPASRPAGRSAATRGRKAALPVPYDRVYERSTSRPAQSAMLFPKLEFDLAGQLAERKVEPPSRSGCERRYVTLPYLVWSFEKERKREIGHLPSAARVTGAMNYTLDIILWLSAAVERTRSERTNAATNQTSRPASADKRGHGEKQEDIKTGGRTGREIRRPSISDTGSMTERSTADASAFEVTDQWCYYKLQIKQIIKITRYVIFSNR